MDRPKPVAESAMPFQGPQIQSLIKCNQKLKDLGIESTIRLPQIAVIGDQSTGKSSLIEALSLINVPRASNCCTQCPISINISAGDHPESPWKCSVSLEERYKYDETIRNKQPSKAHPLGPWRPCPKNFVLFKTTGDKDEVCELIQAAQSALLNPGSNPLDFLPQPGVEHRTIQTIQFSPNIVKLDISEGNWPNMSFIDLPGVITNTEREEDSFLVKMVENLVKEYAKDHDMVNILTLPMTNDMANSKARRVIQEIKAESRTMAVLTKPDQVPNAEARQQFMDKFLDSNDSPFAHGYHIVMMDPDVSLHQDEARKREAEFFMGDPWSSIDENSKARLGIEALREYIRQVLFTKTRDTLPQNLQKIETRLANIKEELAQIPPPEDLSQLPFILFQLLGEFRDSAKKLFLGTGHLDGFAFRKEWYKAAKKFRGHLVVSWPTVFINTDEERRRLNKALTLLAAARNRSRTNEAVEIVSDEDVNAPVTPDSSPTKLTGDIPDKQDLVCRFRLEQIQRLNRKYEISGLPTQSYPEASQEMMAMSVRGWHIPLAEFIDTTEGLINDYATDLMEYVFRKYAKYDLYTVIQKWMTKYLRKTVQEERDHAEALCEIEQSTPFTMACVKKETGKYLQERQAKRTTFRLKIIQAEADLEARVAGTRTSSKTENDLPTDEYQTEIGMSAGVRAYYEIACTRFTDSICQSIVCRLFQKLSRDLAADLHEFLGPTDESKRPLLQQYMAENPQLEKRRQELGREYDRLVEGRQYIQNALGVKATTDDNEDNNADTDTEMGASSTSTNGDRNSHRSGSATLSVTPRKRQRQESGAATLPTRLSVKRAKNVVVEDDSD